MREDDARTLQATWRAGFDIASGNLNLRPHLLKRLEVQINRARADRAAARQADARAAMARKQGAEHEDRGPHLAHQIIRRFQIGRRATDGDAARGFVPFNGQPVMRQ